MSDDIVVDACVNKFIDGGVNLSVDTDYLYCHDSHFIDEFDFNVNDILTQLKFKCLHKLVYNCTICDYLACSNIHFIHHTWGFINLSPLIISSNIPHIAITPTFNNYLSVQQLYSGVPNFISKTVSIASHINVDLFRELGQGFHDQQIFDLIKYGFLLDLDKSSFIPNLAVTNHGSAIKFPIEVDNYFDEEIRLGSIFGLFTNPPLPGLHCSPIMTAPKDGNKRRIIVDLSFPSPQNQAVNISVSKIS
jgi:hypothetical protein